MESTPPTGPIIVCLDEEHDIATLVRCGAALAGLCHAPLWLAVPVVLPPQRPLEILTEQEERRANALLDVAREHASAAGIVAREEIWVVRNLVEAIQRMADESEAGAAVVGWRGSGPLGLFDAGRVLLKTIRCPVVMVGWGRGHQSQPSWPPSWLLQVGGGSDPDKA